MQTTDYQRVQFGAGLNVSVATGGSVQRVDLLVATRGNHFMREIAELYRDGFLALGIRARIVLDQLPDTDSMDTLSLIVAPHEYFPLFAIPAVGRVKLRDIASRAFMLNTEQPGSPWFDVGMEFFRHARGVFDMNLQGVQAFERLGLQASYAPIGYGASLEVRENASTPHAEVDVVFLGHLSQKRNAFFARHASFFQKLDCRLIFVPVDQPRQQGKGSFIAGPERNALLRSAKIMLNIHSAKRDYFEWHRVMCAIANRCLVISETSTGYEPLENGRHLVVDELERLPAHCERLLRDDASRVGMADAAYDLVGSGLSMEHTCQRILDRAHARSISPAGHRHTLSGRVRHHCNSALRRVGRKIAALGNRRLAKRTKDAVRRACIRVKRRSQLSAVETRRNGILQRLAAADHGHTIPTQGLSAEENTVCADCKAPTISVVVTLYNYADYIGECLKSVAASQADRIPGGYEVLVVDDGSTDDSAATVRQLMGELPIPIRLITKHENTGLADSRNVGIAASSAPYVFILDADNLIFPRCLEKLLAAITAGDFAAAYGIISTFDDGTGEAIGIISACGWELERLVRGPYIDAMALFDRRKVQSVGAYSTELLRYGWFGWEDYDLWLKLGQAGFECKQHPEIVAAYRSHPSSMIHVTQMYRHQLTAYFCQKFSDLLERFPRGRSAFGGPLPVVTNKAANHASM